MGKMTIVAACSLNQWALDWEGNVARIKQSIQLSKSKGARLRVGPELEICGYGCLDHFLESDIYLHSWEMLHQILTDETCRDILIDIGMPVEHRQGRYNCRVIALNGKIYLIRPKMSLDNSGNYQEQRYFATWERPGLVEDYVLSEIFNDLQGSQPVPFGDAVLSILGAHLSTFSYHEMLISKPLHAGPKDDVISIHAVSTASHHELGSFDTRFHQLQQIAEKTKGIVVYSDQRGCGGDRTYGDGCAMVFAYGQLVAQGHQFSLEDVEVITAVIELEHDSACQVTQLQSNGFVVSDAVNCLAINFDLSSKLPKTIANGQNDPIEPKSFGIEEQIANGPACWLWDYLRRSHAAGFVVPLSGGIDSGCTATIVFSMCRLVIKALRNGNKQVAADVQRIVGMKDWLPDSPQELCNHILHTIYMGMSGHSSEQTRSRACRLAQDLGAHHTDMNIDSVYQAETDLFRQYLGHTPTFDSELPAENLALQNIQARVRMVTAYYFAQMLPSTRGRSGGGTLLVLSSINVEECLRGSLTKHDCSSADLSPIGSFSKMHIRDFIRWATISFSLPILDEFLTATSRAELEPERFNQHDFKDMGMTHDELWMFGKLRKDHRLGPLSMFQKVLLHWRGQKAFGRLLTS